MKKLDENERQELVRLRLENVQLIETNIQQAFRIREFMENYENRHEKGWGIQGQGIPPA